jgi:transcription elongation factor Elf1
MNGDNPLSIDRLEEFVGRLDAYMSDVVYVEPNPEVERILSLTGFELKSLTSEECCEKAYAIYNYCNFLQKKHNKEVAKAKWCEEFINYAVSKVSNQFDKYTKWEVKVNSVIREDDFVQKVWRVKRVVDGNVASSLDIIRDIRKQADTLLELSRRKYSRG